MFLKGKSNTQKREKDEGQPLYRLSCESISKVKHIQSMKADTTGF